jgi:hypothetical protein
MKQEDSLLYDPAGSRPLPKWLTDQKEGLTVQQPRETVIRKDHSLEISFGITGLVVLLTVIFITILLKKKKKVYRLSDVIHNKNKHEDERRTKP